jgi:WD40 repeat protein
LEYPGSGFDEMCFSPDGRLVATIGVGNLGLGYLLRVREITGEPLITEQRTYDSRPSMQFSPDSRVFTVYNTWVEAKWPTVGMDVWDVPARALLGRTSFSSSPLSFSPGSTTFASVDMGQLCLWDRTAFPGGQDYKSMNRAAAVRLTDPSGPVSNAVFSPDWQLMATVSGDLETRSPAIRLWRSRQA